MMAVVVVIVFVVVVVVGSGGGKSFCYGGGGGGDGVYKCKKYIYIHWQTSLNLTGIKIPDNIILR